MARGKIVLKEDRVRNLLFGDSLNPVSITELSRITKIPRRTLHDYKKDPYRIPLENLIKIVDAVRPDSEMLMNTFY